MVLCVWQSLTSSGPGRTWFRATDLVERGGGGTVGDHGRKRGHQRRWPVWKEKEQRSHWRITSCTNTSSLPDTPDSLNHSGVLPLPPNLSFRPRRRTSSNPKWEFRHLRDFHNLSSTVVIYNETLLVTRTNLLLPNLPWTRERQDKRHPQLFILPVYSWVFTGVSDYF